MSNLLLRIITGIIIAAITLFATYVGGVIFNAFCFVVGGAVLYEWCTITRSLQSQLSFIYTAFIYLCIVTFVSILLPLGYISSFLFLSAIFLFVLSWWTVSLKFAAIRSLGLVYAALFPLSMIVLRNGLYLETSDGLYWPLYLFIVVWASDIGAYICGRICGGPKLAPFISPNKTWSGAIGGTLIAILASLGFAYFMWEGGVLHANISFKEFYGSIPLIVLTSLILSIVSQIGDLGESFLKRKFTVKDSSNLLPGHGGVMDRVDGLLPASVVLVLILALSC